MMRVSVERCEHYLSRVFLAAVGFLSAYWTESIPCTLILLIQLIMFERKIE